MRRITLRFHGPSIAEFRAIIVDGLDDISGSYHQLHYDKMIPCNCSRCKESSDPHFFKYSRLKTRQESGRKPTIECEVSEEDVYLRSLLEGFDVQSIVEKLPDKQGADPTPAQTNSPPITSSQPSMKTIKIFLASSSELNEDRREFELLIGRKNKEYVKDNLFLELVIWEDFLNAMSKTRSQDEYNKAIENCDVFVGLFHTKVGEYTNEEFLVAVKAFENSDRPLIYTYFKDAPISPSSLTTEFTTLLKFQEVLSKRGHFYQRYKDSNDLKHQFSEQLVKLLPQLKQPDT